MFMGYSRTVLVLILSTFASTVQANDDIDRNKRMNQCIRLLQPQDSALRNYWRGHCGETELAAELAAMRPDAQPATVEANSNDGTASEGDACGTALRYTPFSRTPTCGQGAGTLHEKLSRNVVERIRLPGGKCVNIIPLLLTNKKDFACNAIQSRIACMDAKFDPQSDTTTLTFWTARRKNAHSSTVVVTAADMQRVGDRPSDLVTDPQFTLLPARVGGGDVVDSITQDVKSTEDDCLTSGRKRPYCEHRSVSKSDQFMQEWLRKYRNPKKDSPSAKRLADAESLVASMRSLGVDKDLEQWLLFRSIAANEVSLEIHGDRISVNDPIYGVSDAVYDNSGLSFGAHQIDIGANSPDEVALFWDVMATYLAKHRDSAVEQAKAMQACVNLPMRLETVRALDMTYKAAGGMTAGLRSDEGKAEYEGRLAKYLKEQVEKTKALGGMFRNSMLARILFSDHENQFGPSKTVVNRTQSAGLDKDLSTCDGVLAAENDLMDQMLWKWSDGKKVYKDGKAVHAPYFKRYETVRDMVRANVPAGGRSHCG
jgi:hypothetical protein